LWAALSFAFQTATGLNLEGNLSIEMMYAIPGIAFLEKVDILKDLYVAAFLCHRDKKSALILWTAIFLPLCLCLGYFFYKYPD